ncbi:MAG: ThiF family adenylyltransferase [Acidobacteriota bacterium]
MIDDQAYVQLLSRHWGLFGSEGQERIARARVAVGGLGGIGSAAALLFAKASVGKLVICDRQAYGVENVCQQALASHGAVGIPKADAAAAECARHTRHTELKAFSGDLTDPVVAAALVEGADVVVSAVDNPEARSVLGVVCSRAGIPFVVPAAIGWSIIHTVYFPGEWAYDSQFRFMKGIRLSDGLPDMRDELTSRMIRREWRMWSVAVAGWNREALEKFLRGEEPCYWISAPQCFFGASLGILDALKIVSGVGAPFRYPALFCYDTKSHCILSLNDILRRRHCLQEVWEKGPEAVLTVVESWET